MRARSAALLAGGIYVGARLGRELFRERLDWAGKVVLITGGSRGLGLVLARTLVERGARVAICARDPDGLARARADLESRAPRGSAMVLSLTCDVRDRSQVCWMVDEVERYLGPVDVLFNNAGVITMGPLLEQTDEDYAESLDTHFWGPHHCTRAVLPRMLEAGRGRIVNISSIGGKVPVPHLGSYCTGKFALTGYSGALRAELAPHGIGVTTVCPFVMRTGSQVNARFKGRHRAEFSWFMLAGSIPPFSMPAPAAARRIISAVERNQAEVFVGIEAKLGARLYGFCPGPVLGLMGVIAGLMPRPGGVGTQRIRGLESRSALSSSRPTRPVYRAALHNNQVSGDRRAQVVGLLS
jgi:NAD(P)-dependent dehydrogenase (short-subunit alcohol dehydrogenase family)